MANSLTRKLKSREEFVTLKFILSLSLSLMTLLALNGCQEVSESLQNTSAELGMSAQVLQHSLTAYETAVQKGLIKKPILTIIDYSQPSNKKRLWTIDLAKRKLLFHDYVAHGKGSGWLKAEQFSNQENSLQTSLGVYLAKKTYQGKHGLSLRLAGLEKNFNDKAEQRHIVFHGANYVSEAFIEQHGYAGRSWGCPAVDTALIEPLIDHIQEGSLVVMYGQKPLWLKQSHFLNR